MFACTQAPTEQAPAAPVPLMPNGNPAKDPIFKTAEKLRAAEEYPVAIDTLQQISQHLRGRDDVERWLATQRKIAIILVESKSTDDALQHLSKSYETLRQWRPLRSVPEYFQLAVTYGQDNRLSRSIGNYSRARKAIEELEPIFRMHLIDKQAYDIADIFFLQGPNTYVRYGEYEKAENLFNEGIQFSKKYPDAPKDQFFVKYNDFGSLFLSNGNYARALAVFESGLRGDSINHFQTTLLHLNRAEALLRLDSLTAARQANQSVVPMLAQRHLLVAKKPNGQPNYDPLYRCIYGHLENQGLLAAKQNQWAAAADYYRRAADSASVAIADTEARTIAAFKTEEANAYLQLGQARRALDTYHVAWKKLRPASTLRADELPDTQQLFPEKFLIRILEGKAQALAALGDADQALRCYELIPKVEADLRATHTYESSTLLALRDGRRRLEQAVQLAWSRYEATRDTAYLRRAFAFTEQARGLLLLRSLDQAQFDYRLPDSLRQRLTEFEDQIGEQTRQIAALQTQTNLDAEATKTVESLRLRRESFVRDREKFVRDTLYTQYTDFAALSATPQYVTAPDVHRLLRPNQTLLDYFLTPDAVHIFCFEKNGTAHWHRQSLTPQVGAHLDSLLSIVRDRREGRQDLLRFARLGRMFDTLLLPSFLQKNIENQSLVIVPDAELSYLPFEVLLTAAPTANTAWGQLPYLIRSHSIGYAYSASLLQKQQQLTRDHAVLTTPRSIFAGFAPKYSGAAPADLPAARDEVADIRDLLSGQAFLGAEATEAAFKQAATHRRILLLAMHGFVNEDNPELSHLLFGDTLPGQKPDDNILYANELSLMRLSADLAVMNACHSGNGKLQQGEGVYSLSRALTIAGVPSTLMSLWQLSPKTSPVLVRDFFEQMQQHPDMPKDQALQHAKTTLIDQKTGTGQEHPYFWAGFVANGDLQPLDMTPDPSTRQWWWAAGIVPILLALLARRRKARQVSRA
jgi:CHAT domain-containing protein